MTTHHIEVFYLNPRDGWATAAFDEIGNQIGEAAYSYRKTDAIKEAEYMAEGAHPIKVFGRDGFEQRTINSNIA